MLNIIRMDFARMMRSKKPVYPLDCDGGAVDFNYRHDGVGIPGSQGQRRELGDDPGQAGDLRKNLGMYVNNSDQTG